MPSYENPYRPFFIRAVSYIQSSRTLVAFSSEQTPNLETMNSDFFSACSFSKSCKLFLTAILHRGLFPLIYFPYSIWTFISFLYLDFYFPFLFGFFFQFNFSTILDEFQFKFSSILVQYQFNFSSFSSLFQLFSALFILFYHGLILDFFQIFCLYLKKDVSYFRK